MLKTGYLYTLTFDKAKVKPPSLQSDLSSDITRGAIYFRGGKEKC